MFLRDEHTKNAFMPIDVKLLGIDTLDRFVQVENAELPIDFTFAGISIEPRVEQS